eukprot:5568223-Pyramimonas_sp.AAC.1
MATMDLVVKRPADEGAEDNALAIKRQRPNPKIPTGPHVSYTVDDRRTRASSFLVVDVDVIVVCCRMHRSCYHQLEGEQPLAISNAHLVGFSSVKINRIPCATQGPFFSWLNGGCKSPPRRATSRADSALRGVDRTTDGDTLITASPDTTVRAWDAHTGKQIKKMAEHSSFVNSCCPVSPNTTRLVKRSLALTKKICPT